MEVVAQEPEPYFFYLIVRRAVVASDGVNMASKNSKKSKRGSDAERGVPKPSEVVSPAAQVVMKSLSFHTKKIFLGYDEGDNPELEPTFANHFELLGIGSDVYLDIGILKPEEFAAAGMASTDPTKPVEIPFYVIHRIAMSGDTFMRLHVKVTEAQKGLEKLRQDAT